MKRYFLNDITSKILLLLTVIITGLSAHAMADAPTKGEIYRIAQKMLDEQIRKNHQLLLEGKASQREFLIDVMAKVYDGQHFFSKDFKESLNTELNNVVFQYEYKNYSIDPYVVLLPPFLPEVHVNSDGTEDSESYDNYNEEIKKYKELKININSDKFKSFNQYSSLMTFIGKLVMNNGNPAAKYNIKLNGTQPLKDLLIPVLDGNELTDWNIAYKLWPSLSAIEAGEDPSYIHSLKVKSAIENYIKLLEGKLNDQVFAVDHSTFDLEIFENELIPNAAELLKSAYVENKKYTDSRSGQHVILKDITLSKDDLNRINEKLLYLKERTNKHFYVLIYKVPFTFPTADPDNEIPDYATEFVNRIYENSGLKDDKSLLITVPVYHTQSVNTQPLELIEGVITMPRVVNNMDLSFDGIPASSSIEYIDNIYTATPKPYEAYAYMIDMQGGLKETYIAYPGEVSGKEEIISYEIWGQGYENSGPGSNKDLKWYQLVPAETYNPIKETYTNRYGRDYALALALTRIDPKYSDVNVAEIRASLDLPPESEIPMIFRSYAGTKLAEEFAIEGILEVGSLYGMLFGLDAVFDGLGAVYAYSQGKWGEGTFLTAATLLPFIHSGFKKLSKILEEGVAGFFNIPPGLADDLMKIKKFRTLVQNDDEFLYQLKNLLGTDSEKILTDFVDNNNLIDDFVEKSQRLSSWHVSSAKTGLRTNVAFLDQVESVLNKGKLSQVELKAAMDSHLGDVVFSASQNKPQALSQIMQRLQADHMDEDYFKELISKLEKYDNVKTELVNNPEELLFLDDVLRNTENYKELAALGQIPKNSQVYKWAVGKYRKQILQTAGELENYVSDNVIRNFFANELENGWIHLTQIHLGSNGKRFIPDDLIINLEPIRNFDGDVLYYKAIYNDTKLHQDVVWTDNQWELIIEKFTNDESLEFLEFNVRSQIDDNINVSIQFKDKVRIYRQDVYKSIGQPNKNGEYLSTSQVF